MSDKNGGPAFPLSSKWDEPQLNGMTLRDYFAAKATEQDIKENLYGPITEQIRNVGAFGEKQVVKAPLVRTREQAKFAYADAMLEARK